MTRREDKTVSALIKGAFLCDVDKIGNRESILLKPKGARNRDRPALPARRSEKNPRRSDGPISLNWTGLAFLLEIRKIP